MNDNLETKRINKTNKTILKNNEFVVVVVILFLKL